MTLPSLSDLSDADVIVRVKRAAECERLATAELVALLAECDARRLYLGEGFSSLFTYCTQALRLSEAAAYSRITAARAARRFPAILALLSAGEITLTTVGLLSAHLDDENVDARLTTWLDAPPSASRPLATGTGLVLTRAGASPIPPARLLFYVRTELARWQRPKCAELCPDTSAPYFSASSTAFRNVGGSIAG
jgi:hypothetical protein